MARLIKGTIPLKHEEIAIDAITSNYKRPEKIRTETGEEIDNPVSKVDFVNNVLRAFIKENIVAYKANTEAEKAREKAIKEVADSIDLDESDLIE